MNGGTALLLCAGYGTRMGPEAATPKPLLPVGGRALLDHLMGRLLELEGISALHLVTNSLFADRFGRWAEGWREPVAAAGAALSLHDDGSERPEGRRGAVGDLAFLLERAEAPEGALVASGDNLFLFSLAPFWSHFRSGRRSLLLAVREPRAEGRRRSAVLELGAEDRVLALHEKPRRPPSEWTAPALYALRAEALGEVHDYLASGGETDSLGSFIGWLARRRPLYAFRAEGRRLHVGSPAAWREADRILTRLQASGDRDQAAHQ